MSNDLDKKKFGSRPALQKIDLSSLSAPRDDGTKTGLTRSQHELRISQWRDRMEINPDATDFEDDATSAAIAEGVKTMQDWDRKVTNIKRSSQGERSRRKPGQNQGQTPRPPSQTTTTTAQDVDRSELVAELKNIKKMVDPEDLITPRVMVSEFEKYMMEKKLGVSQTPGLLRQTIQPLKRVQFPDGFQPGGLPFPIQRGSQGQAKGQDKGQNQGQGQPSTSTPSKAAINAWLASSTRPDLRLERPGALTKRFTTPANPSPRANSSSVPPPKVRPNSAPEKVGGVVTSPGFGAGPSTRGPDPDWWRRKIRQGMMQTEMLMGELVRQRREDEIFFNATTPYPQGWELHHHNPTTYHHGATSAERNRLQIGLQESRRLHEKCFGSCPLSEAGSRSRSNSRTGGSAAVTRTSVIVHPGHSTGRKSKGHVLGSSDFNNSRDDFDNPSEFKSIKEPRGQGQAGQSQSRASSSRPRPPPPSIDAGDDVKVLFDRVHGFHPTANATIKAKSAQIQAPSSTLNKSATTSLTPVVPPPPPTLISKMREQTVKNLNQFRTKPLIVLDNKSKPTEAKARINKEWVTRLVEVQKSHENKDLVAARKRIATQRLHTNALYSELRRNKSRLTNEVNMEKRKMALNWKLNKHSDNRNSSEDTLRLPTKVRSGGMSKPRSRSQSKSRSRPSPAPYSPKHLHSLDAEAEAEEAAARKGVTFPRWKETPRGLSLWLENVVSKAKEEKVKAEEKVKRAEAEERERHRARHRISTHPAWAPLPKSRDQF